MVATRSAVRCRVMVKGGLQADLLSWTPYKCIMHKSDPAAGSGAAFTAAGKVAASTGEGWRAEMFSHSSHLSTEYLLASSSFHGSLSPPLLESVAGRLISLPPAPWGLDVGPPASFLPPAGSRSEGKSFLVPPDLLCATPSEMVFFGLVRPAPTPHVSRGSVRAEMRQILWHVWHARVWWGWGGWGGVGLERGGVW